MSTCAQCKIIDKNKCLFNWFEYKASENCKLKTSLVEWNIVACTFSQDVHCARKAYEIF